MRQSEAIESHWSRVYDWLVRRAEIDLEVARALLDADKTALNHIKHLQDTLVQQLLEFKDRFSQTREHELREVKDGIVACAIRVRDVEAAVADIEKLKTHLALLETIRAELPPRVAQLQEHQAELKQLSVSLADHIKALEHQNNDQQTDLSNLRKETRYLKAETEALAERISQAESAVWQARATVLRNVEQLGETEQRVATHAAALQNLTTTVGRRRGSPLLIRAVRRHTARIHGLQRRLCLFEHALGGIDVQVPRIIEELGSLRSQIDHHSPEALLETYRQQAQDTHAQLAQRLLLLETRETERQRQATDIPKAFIERLNEQELRSKSELAAHSENVLAKVRELAEQVLEAGAGLKEVRSHFEAFASKTTKFETNISDAVLQLRSEVTQLKRPEELPSFVDARLADLQGQLTARIEEIERQLSAEKEDIDHWINGLRESFGSELSALQARLLERYSELEHRYTSVERNQKTIDRIVTEMESRLQAACDSAIHNPDRQNTLSQLHSIIERLDELDAQKSQIEERLTSCIVENQNQIARTFEELRSVKMLTESRTAIDEHLLTSALEFKIDSRIQQVESNVLQDVNSSKSFINTRLGEFQDALTKLDEMLHSTRRACEEAHHDFRSSSELETFIENKAKSLNVALLERIERLENQPTACPTEDNKHAVDEIRREIEAIHGALSVNKVHEREASISEIRDSFTSGINQLHHELLLATTHAQNQAADQRQWLERTISDVRTELDTLKAQVNTPLKSQDSPLPWEDLRNRLESTMEELRTRIDEQVARFERSERELVEIRQQIEANSIESAGSANTTRVVAELSRSTNAAGDTVQLSTRPHAISSTPNKGLSAAAPEQLQELQERMAAEIERVRAELKQRSGRWKVRKTGS